MRAEKKYAIEEYQKNLNENSCAILTDYAGISSEQLNAVRAGVDERHGDYQVVQNRLFALAASELGIEGFDELLDGQVGVVYSDEERSIEMLKYLVKFRKDNEVLGLLGGVLAGTIYCGKDLEALSRLPGKEMMRARVVGVFKAPLSNLAQVMRGRLLSLLYVINAIIDKRGSSGDTEAPSVDAG